MPVETLVYLGLFTITFFLVIFKTEPLYMLFWISLVVLKVFKLY